MNPVSEDVYSVCEITVSRSADHDKCIVTATETSADGTTTSINHPPQSIVKGITCPVVCNERRWLSLNENIKYRNGDIIVRSYPKSGTT